MHLSLPWVTAIAFVIAGAPAAAIEPEPIHLGFLAVVPAFDTKVTSTGNLLLPNGEEQSSELLLFKPRVTALAVSGDNQFSSSLEIHNGNYSASGAGNFIDWKFESAASFAIDQQSRIRVRAEHFNTHEAAGVDLRRKNSFVPERFTTSTLNTSYEYGRNQDRGRLVLDATTFIKQYLSEDTDTKHRNSREHNWGSTFNYRVLPGTNMFLQYRARDIAWPDSAPGVHGTSNHSLETFAYAGATWEIAARLTGKLKVVSGYKEIAVRADRALTNSSSWETNVRWEPLKDSIVTVNADHILHDPSGLASARDTRNVRYNWEYQWSSQLKSTIAGNYSANTELSTAHKDEGLGVKVRMDYSHSSWLSMFMAVGHDERKSMFTGFNFSQQTFMLGIAASLEHLLGK